MGRSFVVIEHAAPTIFDTGPAGDSIGDLRVFSNDLHDAATRKVVGTDQGLCVRTAPGKRWECTWSNIFAEGVIVTQGPGLDSAFQGEEITVAITGGTGDYTGARGVLSIKKLQGRDHEFAFTFSLD